MTNDSPQPAAGTFASLALGKPLQRALLAKNYTIPTPIQAQAIPPLLAGRDLIGVAQTGTGKTAAFALPILERFAANPRPRQPKRPRALILAPTRELAAQIGDSFAAYGKNLKLTHAVIFGGVGSSPQIRALARGVDILVATPGRLADLEQQRHLSLDQVEVFVLDEADRMLDQGFIHEIRRIVKKLPPRRQSLLFSATMPQEIEDLASSIVSNPARVEVTPVASTSERIDQQVCFVGTGDKPKLLVHLLRENPEGLALIFVRMKHQANRIAEHLEKNGLPADAIHGNKSQGARQRALENFRSGRKRILVATDIAARGIDVKGIELVINFNLPEEPEAYVHRIGRTARAGRDGSAISLCDATERGLLRSIERLIRKPVPVKRDHPFAGNAVADSGAEQRPLSDSPRQHRPQRPHHSGAPRESGQGDWRPDGNAPHRHCSQGGRPFRRQRPRSFAAR